MEQEKNSFQYTYSAKEQEELKRIRQKYQPKEKDKMEQLRRLDAGVTAKAQVVSLVLGVIGVLIMGGGMSLVMTSLPDTFGMSEAMGLAIGILIGIIGIAMVISAYPVYNSIIKKERERIAPEILRLTDELMK